MRRSPLVTPLLAMTLGAAACSSTPPTPSAVTPGPTADTASPPATPAARHDVLLGKWSGPYGGVPPWDLVETDLLEPAIDEGAKLYLAEVDAIANSGEAPTFDNTLGALERAGKPLERAATAFFVMAANMNTPEVQDIATRVRPKLSDVEDTIHFNAKLFARVEAVYNARDKGLDAEQKRLAEKKHDDFIRRGARLGAADKTKLGEINQELAQLFTDFGNRVQRDEDTWVVLKKEDLRGLPEPMVAAYAAAAAERKLEGYAVVNTRSAVDPFLTFSDDRKLREKVWRAFVDRGDNGNDNDTNALIKRIVELRAARAKLLGYASHAHWRMSDTMAKDPERAKELMLRVWPAAVERVKQEVADMQALARKEGQNITIEPWDYRYYMEKVRKARYDLDQNEFKSYFELENMIAASYYMAERLYGYAFKEVTGKVPVFHPDIRVYEVTNKADGSYVGLLYRDDFARQYKRSGAWQATYQRQHKLGGQVHAIVSNNNNFTKSGKGEPVLISLDDAETLFHEFGHALHALTNDTTHPSLGTTPRDFVEFPSQVHENWVLTREVLDKYAVTTRHASRCRRRSSTR
jgi:peptidyl-dipeptidase Dcp